MCTLCWFVWMHDDSTHLQCICPVALHQMAQSVRMLFIICNDATGCWLIVLCFMHVQEQRCCIYMEHGEAGCSSMPPPTHQHLLCNVLILLEFPNDVLQVDVLNFALWLGHHTHYAHLLHLRVSQNLEMAIQLCM